MRCPPLHRVVWALRTAAVCAVASLGCLLTGGGADLLPPSSVFFGVLVAAVACQATLGATARAAAQYSSGAAVGGAFAAACLALLGCSPAAVWFCVIAGSMVLLLWDAPPASVKLALGVYLSGMFVQIDSGCSLVSTESLLAARFPLLLAFSSCAGTALALLGALFCAARARKQSRDNEVAATHALINAARAALQRFNKASCGATAAASRAAAAYAASTAIRSSSASLADDVSWEESLACCYEERVFGLCCSRNHLMIAATAASALDALQLAVEGMMAAAAAREVGDGRLQALHAAAAALAPSLATSSSAGSDIDGTGATDGILASHAAVIAAALANAALFDNTTALPASRLLDASCDALACGTDQGSSDDSDSTSSARTRHAKLALALADFDASVIDARIALFYTQPESTDADDRSSCQSLCGVASSKCVGVVNAVSASDEKVPSAARALDARGEAINMSFTDVALLLHGLPAGRYLFVWAVRAFALAVDGSLASDAVDTLRSSSDTSVHVRASPAPPPRTRVAFGIVCSTFMGAIMSHLACHNVLCSRCSLQLTLSRALYAARLTLAVAAAGALGIALFGSGVWPAAAVAFVGPRGGAHAGGSLHAAFLRAVGTIAGSCAGLAIAALAGGGRDGLAAPLPLALLAMWVVLAGLARGSTRHAYGVAVAQFTPYVLLVAGSAEDNTTALRRVLSNLLGVAVFATVELLIAPSTIGATLRREVANGLAEASAAVECIWVAQLGDNVHTAENNVGTSHAPQAVAAVARHVAALRRSLAAQRVALIEAEDEKDWAPLSLASGGAEPPLALRAAAATIEAEEHAAVLIALMQAVLLDGGAGGARPLASGVARPLRILLAALGAHYAALRRAVDPPRVWPPRDEPQRRGPPGDATTLGAAIVHLDAAVAGAFVTLVRDTRSATRDAQRLADVGKRQPAASMLLPTRELVSFITLAWCTHELGYNAVQLKVALRDLHRDGADSYGAEHDDGDTPDA